MQFVIDYGGELHQVQYPPDVNPSLSLSLSYYSWPPLLTASSYDIDLL